MNAILNVLLFARGRFWKKYWQFILQVTTYTVVVFPDEAM